MAENHPVGFQWVMEARERGAEVIHVDPRFTRTSAMATKLRRHPRRLRHRVPRRHRQLHPRERALVRRVREALHERAGDHRRARSRTPRISTGCSPGFDPETNTYDNASWQYEGHGGQELGRRAAEGRAGRARRRQREARARRAARARIRRCSTRRCVFQILKRHFARYTPGVRRRRVRLHASDEFLYVAEALCANSGRERTSAFAYAVGWTQHTVGVQIIRTAAIIQLLLGNIGPARAAASSRCAATRRSRGRPTSRRSTTRCPATSACRTSTTRGTLREWLDEYERAGGLVGSHRRVPRLAPEGVVGRGGDREERVVLRLAAAHRRRQLALLDGAADARREGEGLHRRRREPGGRIRERPRAAARRSRSSTGSSCATSSRSRPRRSGTTAPRSSPAS